jgi:hypothetical protein
MCLLPQGLVEDVMSLSFAVTERRRSHSDHGLFGRITSPDHATDLILLMKCRDEPIEDVQSGGRVTRSDFGGKFTLL